MPKVAFNNLKWSFNIPSKVFEDVRDSGQFILGENVKTLESAIAKTLNLKDAVGVANGTDALELALRSVGVKEKDLVATVANSAVPTTVAIEKIGAVPAFVDVEKNGLMDLYELREVLSSLKVKAIVPVHLYGQMVNMQSLSVVARAYQVPIVEDAAQAYNIGTDLGMYSEAVALSFYPTKILGAMGDGGMVVSNHKWVTKIVRQMRTYGLGADGMQEMWGCNSRLDELQAAIVLENMKGFIAKQNTLRNIANHYFDHLPKQLLHRKPSGPNNWHLFTIVVGDREYFQRRLLNLGVETSIHYKYPAYFHTNSFSFKGKMDMTGKLANHILSIPCWYGMTLQDVEYVTECVTTLFESNPDNFTPKELING